MPNETTCVGRVLNSALLFLMLCWPLRTRNLHCRKDRPNESRLGAWLRLHAYRRVVAGLYERARKKKKSNLLHDVWSSGLLLSEVAGFGAAWHQKYDFPKRYEWWWPYNRAQVCLDHCSQVSSVHSSCGKTVCKITGEGDLLSFVISWADNAFAVGVLLDGWVIFFTCNSR